PVETVVPKPKRESEAEEILIKNTGSFIPEERQEVEAPTPDKEQDKEQEKPAELTVANEPHHTGMKIVGKIDLSSLRKGGKAQPKAIKEEEPKQDADESTPQEAAVEPVAADNPVEQPEKDKPVVK